MWSTPTPTPTPLPSLETQQRRLFAAPPAADLAVCVPPLQRRGPAARKSVTTEDETAKETVGVVATARHKKRPRANGHSKFAVVAHRAECAGRKPPAAAAAAAAAKPRKPSYVAQREERDKLADEMRALEARVEALRHRAGLPTKEDKAAIAHTRERSLHTEERIHANRRSLDKLLSLVMRKQHVPPVNPMTSFIHLPVDMDGRRAVLRELQELKFRRAEEFAVSRLHHLDHAQPYLSEERFETRDGRYHVHRIEIVPFPNFRTVRQLYDALVKFLYNLEISVTETLGQIAIREDFEDIDPTIWNQRIVTTADDVGCEEELNVVGFARFYDAAASPTGSPYGLVVYDTVDVDDLYPYRPHERTTKDVTGTNFVCEVRRPGSENETLVVLKRGSYTAQLPAQFPLAPGVWEKLTDNISRWPEAIVQYLLECRV